MSVTSSGPGKCLVCATPINSIHFGIDACRACSSFFKRAKISGKKYPCRQGGGGKCEITRGDNFVCRRCRYDKCVAVGMVYEGLMRPAKKLPLEISLKAFTLYDKPSTSGDTILGKIAREYNEFVERRRLKERIVISSAVVKERIYHPTEEIYCTNFNCTLPTIYISVAETWNFFKEVFPSLMKHSVEDQKELFRSFLPKVQMLEGFYRTSRIFGGFDQFMMCSVLICVNMNLPEEWLPLNEGGKNRNSLVQSMQLFINDQMALVIPCLERTQMTETEMHAMLALILCDSDLKTTSSESLLASLDEIRNDVICDLRRYYKEELGLNDFSMRLGNLMSLCHTVREGTCIFQECFRMQIAIFDLYAKETVLKEFFL